MDGMTSESSQSYKCRYCEKEFRKESTLAAHLCEQKRRYQQKDETGVQLGLRAYLRFYEITQGSARLKSYDDFCTSPYYGAFVKFGRHLVAIRAVSPNNFIDWLLKNNKKLDQWCKDSFYEEWLHAHLRKEATQDALERALKEMQDYADTHPDLKNGYRDYFKYGNGNRICHHIVTGRISPWVIFNSSSGVEFLESLSEEQLGIIMPWIDPEYWQKRFADYVADTEWCKHVLKEAGL
jgi:uncharacterized protein CbrC (UPF0167 family)